MTTVLSMYIDVILFNYLYVLYRYIVTVRYYRFIENAINTLSREND